MQKSAPSACYAVRGSDMLQSISFAESVSCEDGQRWSESHDFGDR